MTAQGPLTKAVAAALREAQIPARDQAAVALARRYAGLLDAARGGESEVDVFDRLGPKLLAALVALRMAGRGAQGGGRSGSAGTSPLDELRARREQRQG